MRLTLLFLFLFGISNAMSQDVVIVDTAQKKNNKTEKLDSGKVETRKFDEEAVTTYSKQKEFIYDDVAPETLSWWDRFWRAFWDFIRSIFNGSGSGKSSSGLILFAKYFTIILAVAIIVFVVVKVMGLDLSMLLGKSKTVEVPYEESLENIHEIDFSEQLEKALQQKNYRLAVRLLYLQTLKQLTDREIINWQPEKTNNAYVAEINDKNRQSEFGQLTYQFEYIWYGDFGVDKERFEAINQSFQQFNQQTK